MIIAQISDIHAASDNDNLSRLDRALHWLDRLKPDVLVVSGDLIDDNWFEGYGQIAGRLNKRCWPTYLLPGNSDSRDRMRRIFDNGYYAKNACHFAVNTGKVRLIGLDTTIAGEAAGAVAPHLGWLRSALAAAPALPSLLFLHHPVIMSGIPTMDRIMCRDSAELEAFFDDVSPRPVAIAMGHVHRPAMGMFAGIPACICGAICPANPVWFGAEHVPAVNDPPALMIHYFNQGSLVSHHVSV
jgi:3',5'-cyclic AMP phosphodiesterase CpdA